MENGEEEEGESEEEEHNEKTLNNTEIMAWKGENYPEIKRI